MANTALLRVFVDGDRGRHGQRRLVGNRRDLDVDRIDLGRLRPRWPTSVAVAVTVMRKSTSLSAGGETDRFVRFQLVMSTVELAGVPVNVLVPSVIVAPTGMSLKLDDQRLAAIRVDQRCTDRRRPPSSHPR